MTTIEEQVAQLDELTVDALKEKPHELGCSVSRAKAVIRGALYETLKKWSIFFISLYRNRKRQKNSA